MRFFEFSHSRSHLEAKGILGADFRGWLVTDFYAAYNLIPGPHQRCWVHLLRDLHALKEAQAANPEVLAGELKACLGDPARRIEIAARAEKLRAILHQPAKGSAADWLVKQLG